MADLVSSGATIKCMWAKSTKKLRASGATIKGSGKAVATINDHTPFLNIPSFGMCTSPMNPMCLPTPSGFKGPCIPMTFTPWIPGKANVMSVKIPILTKSSICLCTPACGVISIKNAGQKKVRI